MQCAASTSGRVILKEPRNDFASAVRELFTTTASLMLSPYRVGILIHLFTRKWLMMSCVLSWRGLVPAVRGAVRISAVLEDPDYDKIRWIAQ